jgi:hypothetical protein
MREDAGRQKGCESVKLRLHAGSLRLRLSQSEVARLDETGRVEDSIEFSPGTELLYAIEAGTTPSIIATFDNGHIRVVVPNALAKEWIGSDQTGIEASAGTLKVLIEKDFQCLHREPDPGEDSFPNPLAAT